MTVREEIVMDRTNHGIPIIVLTTLLFLALMSVPVAAEDMISGTFPGDDHEMAEGEEVTFRIELVPDIDADKATIQWYRQNEPVFGDGLTYTFAPGFDDAGTYRITVFVVYNGTSDTHDWTLTVTDVKEKFKVASSSPTGDVHISEGGRQAFSVNVLNPADDILTYRWAIDGVLQLGTNISTFMYRPGLDDQGTRTVKVVVESSDNTEEVEWRLRVDDSMEVMPVGNVEVPEGGTMDFVLITPQLSDSEVLWYLDGSVGNIGMGNRLTYRPDHASSGIHRISMNTSTGLGHEWTVKVLDVNRPPMVEAGKVRKATTGQSAKFQAFPTDPDGDIEVFEWDFDGDGIFDHTSDRSEVVTHTYKNAGVYIATFKATDSHGASAVTTYQYVVSESDALSGWYIASILLAVLVVLLFIWVLYDREKERRRARIGTDRLATLPTRSSSEGPRPRKGDLPLFEDVEEEGPAPEDMVMVPYASKMADRGMDSEVDGTEDTEIAVSDHTMAEDAAPHAADLEEAEGRRFTEDERKEIDDILSSLTAKALGKADLKSKKASAEVKAQDTDTELGMDPSARPRERKRKGKRKRTAPKAGAEDKAGTSKGAESDMEAEQTDVDLIMKDLIDKGLAERRTKERRK